MRKIPAWVARRGFFYIHYVLVFDFYVKVDIMRASLEEARRVGGN